MNYKKVEKIINYSAGKYFCKVFINKRWFTKIEISEYYKSKKGRSTVSDEKIVELVRQLNGRNFKREKNGYYSDEPLYIDYRAYNLVWDCDDDEFVTALLIINCYRERKYDKK